MRAARQVVGSIGGSLALLGATVPSAAAQAHAAPTITAVTTNVNIGTYNGRCPAKLMFKATITAAAVLKGPVTYQWIHSDNTKSPKRTVRMTGTTVVVSENWQGGRSGEQMRLWRKLQVLTPNAITSDQADVAVLCH
jgi:hypothetical protein